MPESFSSGSNSPKATLISSFGSHQLPQTPRQLAEMIDQTLLKPELTEKEVRAWAETNQNFGFKTFCVHPRNLLTVQEVLKGVKTLPIAVVGFPLGTQTSRAKWNEAEEAVTLGAMELDIVIPIGLARAGDWSGIQKEILPITQFKNRSDQPIPVKLILETHFLSDQEKRSIAERAKDWGITYLKTSSGFTGGGATIDDIKLLRKYADPSLKIKASGGIKELDFAFRLIAAGADRLGTSNGGQLVQSFEQKLSTPNWKPEALLQSLDNKNLNNQKTGQPGTY